MTKNIMVRWIEEDETYKSITDDPASEEIDSQIESGKLLHFCALVETQCNECQTWHFVTSLGSVVAPPNAPYWEEVEKELIEENS